MINNTRTSKTFIVRYNVYTVHIEIVESDAHSTVVKVIDKYAVNCATVDSKGEKMGLCNVNGEIGVFDLSKLKYLQKIPMHDLPVQGCCFSSNDEILMTGSVDYKIGFVSSTYVPSNFLTSSIAILFVLAISILLGKFFSK